MTRITDLLDKAAEALEQGEDPLSEYFLTANDVTFTECLDLAAKLAMGARLVSWATRNPEQAAEFASGGVNGMGMAAITRLLKAKNEKAKADR